MITGCNVWARARKARRSAGVSFFTISI